MDGLFSFLVLFGPVVYSEVTSLYDGSKVIIMGCSLNESGPFSLSVIFFYQFLILFFFKNCFNQTLNGSIISPVTLCLKDSLNFDLIDSPTTRRFLNGEIPALLVFLIVTLISLEWTLIKMINVNPFFSK